MSRSSNEEEELPDLRGTVQADRMINGRILPSQPTNRSPESWPGRILCRCCPSFSILEHLAKLLDGLAKLLDLGGHGVKPIRRRIRLGWGTFHSPW